LFRSGSGRERESREEAAWGWLTGGRSGDGGVSGRWRGLFSATSCKICVGGGFGSPEPEAAVAVVSGDGIAGELDGGSEGRRDLV
jgi:hypothetical protein